MGKDNMIETRYVFYTGRPWTKGFPSRASRIAPSTGTKFFLNVEM
jgi:hypothetical protein